MKEEDGWNLIDATIGIATGASRQLVFGLTPSDPTIQTIKKRLNRNEVPRNTWNVREKGKEARVKNYHCALGLVIDACPK